MLFFLPMVISTGLCILSSVTIFPESVNQSFRAKLHGVLSALSSALVAVDELFAETQRSTDHADESESSAQERLVIWAQKSETIRGLILSSLAGLTPLRAQQKYLNIDFSHSRLSGDDLRHILDAIIKLQARSSGLALFFDIVVRNARHSHLDSSVYTVQQALDSRPNSRPVSIRSGKVGDSKHEFHGRAHSKHLPTFIHRRSSPAGLKGHRDSHMSLLDHRHKSNQPVGLYESFRYMELEREFNE